MMNFLNFKKNIFQKEKITILVTDSGMGGVSVAKDLYDFFKTNLYYNYVNIVYADCRNKKIGYNSIDDLKVKTTIFSNQIKKLYKKIKPDIIFIACNTLSVLIDKTDFYYQIDVPIIDMRDCSLNLMMSELNKNRGLFILGTKTTISENFYKKSLINFGYSKENIVNQLCPTLAKHIENSYENKLDMELNVQWLANRIKEKKPSHFTEYTISFNCTHYIYTIKYFINCFKKINETPNVICPNINIKNTFTDYLKTIRFSHCDVFLTNFNCNKKFDYFINN